MSQTSHPVRILLWRYPLDVDLSHLAECLSPDESERADRFRRPADRHHWVTSRVWLRRTLGDYLGIEPTAIRFCYGPNGKPEVANRPPGLTRFNLSHAGGVVVIAVSDEAEVGVDIEPTRKLMDLWAVAEISLSDAERQLLRSVPQGQQPRRFFEYWTCKEAIIKAHGLGLGEMSSIDLLSRNKRWQVLPIQLPDPHVGAVAVTGAHESIEIAWMEPVN